MKIVYHTLKNNWVFEDFPSFTLAPNPGRNITGVDNYSWEEGEQLPGHANLSSIKGIGTLSATVLLTAIGPIQDFADEDKLAAYLGLVPKIQNSNETERSGGITKRGNKLARTALVQCGLVAQRYSPYLKRFYERIKQRRGGGKAKIALARKLVKIVYHTLKNNWVFEDFPSFTLAPNPGRNITGVDNYSWETPRHREVIRNKNSDLFSFRVLRGEWAFPHRE